jgi:hypothetical protein
MGHIELAAAQVRRKMAAMTPVKVGTATCIKNPKQFFETSFCINLPLSVALLQQRP